MLLGGCAPSRLHLGATPCCSPTRMLGLLHLNCLHCRVSAGSQELMAHAHGAPVSSYPINGSAPGGSGGGGSGGSGGSSFLDRLANDKARRESKLRELQQRHQLQAGAAGEQAGGAALARDRSCIQRYCVNHWQFTLDGLGPQCACLASHLTGAHEATLENGALFALHACPVSSRATLDAWPGR